MKKYFVLTAILLAVIFLSGCSLTQSPAKNEKTSQTIKPADCGGDENCANNLLTNCSDGSFTSASKKDSYVHSYMIKSKNLDGSCTLEMGFINAQYPFKDQKMACTAPQSIQTVGQFEDYISENNYISCVGALRDVLVQMNKIQIKNGAAEPGSATLAECGSNITCANDLIKNCTKGIFTYGEPNPRSYSVKNKNTNGTCLVEWGYVEQKYPLTGKMACSVPTTVQTVSQFEEYTVKDDFSVCSGPLKDAITKPSNEILPEPIAEENNCADAACTQRLLENCTRGTLSVKRIRDNKTTEVKFLVTGRKVASNSCYTEASIIQSPQSNLIGPKMNCVLENIITSYDVQQFITDKFRQISSESSSYCTGELYELVKDMEL
jgi:hypothetical protein